MECHEIWVYAMPPKSPPHGSFGVQQLIGLSSLCQGIMRCFTCRALKWSIPLMR